MSKKYFDSLDNLLDRPIAFNPAFLRIIYKWVRDKAHEESKRYGNAIAPAAAVFLSQAWYWSKRTTLPDEWFYKSQKEWEEETGLSYSTQLSCRRMLGKKGMGIISEKLKGVPATMHYKVHRERIYDLLGLIQSTDPQETELPDPVETGLPDPQETSLQTDSELVPDATGNLNTEITSEITETENTTDINLSFQKRGDLVDAYLQFANSPGLKRQVRIDNILSYLAGKLNINTETKRWKEFAKFVDDKQQDGQKVDVFVSWLLGQKNFDIQFWPPSKMQEMWPQAFIKSATPTHDDHRKYLEGKYADFIE